MSKSINMLKTAREQKLSKYSAALNKADNPQNCAVSSKGEDSKRGVWPLALFFAIVFLLILIFNAALFISVRTKFSDLKTLQGSINNNTKQIAALSSSFQHAEQELKAAGIKIQDGNKRISQLQKLSDANSTAIENLTKAKNKLFDRASKLETELNNLKSVKTQ